MLLAMLSCVLLMYKVWQSSDGLAWLILTIASGVGTIVGAVVGWYTGPLLADQLNAAEDRAGISEAD